MSSDKILYRKGDENKQVILPSRLKPLVFSRHGTFTQPAINNRNTRTKCEICSKLTIKIPERRQ